MSQLKLSFLGPPSLEYEGAPVEVNRRKSVALITYLAVTGEPHSRDKLATLLWPDYDQSRARATLRSTLWALNKTPIEGWLAVDQEMIGLKLDPNLWVDVAQFHHLLAGVEKHSHPPGEVCTDCLIILSEAVTLYRADFLAGFTLPDSPEFDEWQFFQTEGLRQELSAVLERLARGYMAEAKYETALPYARRWLSLDPLHEPAHRLLMRLYAQTGQQAAALRQYQECVRLLAEELGMPPEAATLELYELIKAKRLPLAELGEQNTAPGSVPAGQRGAGTAKRKQEAVKERAEFTPLVQVEPEAGNSPLPSPLSQMPFVGRGREYGQLVDLIQQTTVGKGHIVLIGGEAGIGKSRLVQEAANYAQAQRLFILQITCYQVEQAMPYQPIMDLVDQIFDRWPEEIFRSLPPSSLAEIAALVPEVGDLLPDLPDLPAGLNEARQARLFRALGQLLEIIAGQQGLFLALDDIHWADHASLQFLHHLARHLAEQPILLVCAYRSEEIATNETLAALVHGMTQDMHVLPLVPARLSLEDATALLEPLILTSPQVMHLAEWLYRETDGNPFFLVSILHSLLEQDLLTNTTEAAWQLEPQQLDAVGAALTLPEALREWVRGRLRRLPQGLRRVLEVAAVLGRRFDFTTLQAAISESATLLLDDLENLVQRQLLREAQDGSYDFSHDKVREVVYHDISPTRRIWLHRSVAEVLERQPDGRLAATLAGHYEQGQVWVKGITYLAQAADRAKSLFALREALGFYDRAIGLAQIHAEATDQQTWLNLHEGRGDARALAGEFEGAIADLRLALTAARHMGEEARKQHLLVSLGMVYRRTDNYEGATTCLQEALAVARANGDQRSVADILYHLGTVAFSRGDNRQVTVYHQEAVEICRQLELADHVAMQALHGRAEAFYLAGQPHTAAQLFTESLELARQLGDKGYETENLLMLAAVYSFGAGGDYSRARSYAEQALPISQAAYMDWHTLSNLYILGFIYVSIGDYEHGLAYINRAIELAERLGSRRSLSIALDWLGCALRDLNLLEKAVAVHSRGVQVAREIQAGYVALRLQTNLAIDRLRLGLFDVDTELLANLEAIQSLGQVLHATRCLEGLAELSLVRGEPERTLAYVDQLLALAEVGGMHEVIAVAKYWRGEAWLASGAFETAEAELQQAAALAEEIGRVRLKWDVHAALAKLYRAQGQPEAAARHEDVVRAIVAGIANNLTDNELKAGLEPN